MKYQKQTQTNSDQYQALVTDLQSDLVSLGGEIQNKPGTESLKKRILLASKDLAQDLDSTTVDSIRSSTTSTSLLASLSRLLFNQASATVVASVLLMAVVLVGVNSLPSAPNGVNPLLLEEADLTFQELLLAEDELLFASN